MGRKPNEPEAPRFTSLILLSWGLISCAVVYTFLSFITKSNDASLNADLESLTSVKGSEFGECCQGIENLELWGSAVKWGSEFKFNSSKECCEACKAMCTGNDGPCLCDTWVFCGNKDICGSRFGECWLKKQKDVLAPDRQEAGKTVMWASGLIYGKGEGIIGLETDYGTLHIKLLPECAPHSVAYILELLTLRHCAGCQFHRGESRGESWDVEGNHINNAPFGPPFALIQGTLEAQGITFKEIPTEVCPLISRGSVAWVGSGPEFFISLANHQEWKNSYSVFGSVLPEDMGIAEKIALLPTKSDVWNGINVTVLKKPVALKLRRMKPSLGDLNSNRKSE
ncbi:hypothetical protein Pint_15749 [Pistacia integerrima]|uniref:Uncharacterized protein n=1 Tax=Pistacia integerrima TaxID=434235 RepID=A0ACC0ZCY6_9ROSI|nr:hypothetical protein Pint_15749 [Pistacia integerrima]